MPIIIKQGYCTNFQKRRIRGEKELIKDEKDEERKMGEKERR
jgi:hypothetical protein